MPTLNKQQVKTRPPRMRNPYSTAIEPSKCYATTTWKMLRQQKMIEQPLCEICLTENRITPATDVHHIVTWQDKGAEWRSFAFDYNNLMCLCEECHYQLHDKMKKDKNNEEQQSD